jgi:hypothetical protein
VGCLLYIDGAVYDLQDLKGDADYRKTVSVDNTTNSTSYILFDICRTANSKCNGDTVFASMFTEKDNNTTCKKLSSDSTDDVKIDVLGTNFYF